MSNELPQEILGLQERAGRGDLAACYALGRCHADAKGVTKDETEAAAWFKRAAEQGHADSQFALAVAYLNGTGVDQNPTAAARWPMVWM